MHRHRITGLIVVQRRKQVVCILDRMVINTNNRVADLDAPLRVLVRGPYAGLLRLSITNKSAAR